MGGGLARKPIKSLWVVYNRFTRWVGVNNYQNMGKMFFVDGDIYKKNTLCTQ